MSRHLHDLVFRQLVPESIRSDSQMAAAADSLSPLLQTIVRAVPNLLIYGRLDGWMVLEKNLLTGAPTIFK